MIIEQRYVTPWYVVGPTWKPAAPELQEVLARLALLDPLKDKDYLEWRGLREQQVQLETQALLGHLDRLELQAKLE